MDKNDFDMEFDFDKEYDDMDLNDQAEADTPNGDEDLDLGQFEGETGDDQFQDFDLEDDEEFQKLLNGDNGPQSDPGRQDLDQDYSENEDPDEDLFFPRKERQEEQEDFGPDFDPQQYDPAYDPSQEEEPPLRKARQPRQPQYDDGQPYEEGGYDQQYDQGGYDPAYDPQQGDYDPNYDPNYEGGEYDPSYDPDYNGQGYEEPPKKEKKKLSLPKLPKREKKEKKPRTTPTFFEKFMAWYMEPINRRKNPEPEAVDENGRRRRRKKPTKMQIIKEAYLPPLFALIAMILIVSFVAGSLTNVFKAKKINDEKKAAEALQASEEADRIANEYQDILKEAQDLATQYDYDGAIAKLDSFQTDDEAVTAELNSKRSGYLNEQASLQEWKDYSTIPNLSFHVLIQDPIRAFADSENGGQYNRNFVTTEEFSKILNQLYNNGYVLVDFNSFVASNVDLTGSSNFSYNSIWLPANKKPVMLTETMVNYFQYMVDGNKDGEPDAAGAGFANKLVVQNGEIKAAYVDGSGQSNVGDYDFVPILESFIAEHPDFSYRGARATLAVTGSQGVFGYRTDTSYVSSNGQQYYDDQVAQAKEVVQALRDRGYTIACFSYANKDYRSLSVSEIRTDIQNFTNQAVPVLGEVDTIVFARATDIDDYSGNKFTVLYDQGYRYFVGQGSEPKTDINITYVHQNRLMVTGNAMAWHSNQFSDYFDCNVVLDVSNRGNVPN